MHHTRNIVWIIVLLLLATTSTVVNAEPAQQGGLVTTVTTRMNLRAGPGTEWRLLGRLEVGTTVALDGRDPSGLWVRGITSDGRIGWMGARFVAISTEQAFALPSIWVDTPFSLSAPGAGSAPSAPVPAANPENPPASIPGSGGLVVTANSTVNVRSGPGTNNPRISSLGYGASVRVDGRDSTGQWVHATLSDGSVGWIFASYLAISGSDLASLPVVDGGATVVSAPAAPQPAAPSAPAVYTAPVAGFNLGGQVAGFSDTAANWMRRARMNWVKRQWRYGQGQNSNDVGGIINDAHARGFRILVSVVGQAWEVNNSGYFVCRRRGRAGGRRD